MDEDASEILANMMYKHAKELAVRYARVPGVHILVRTEKCTGCKKCIREGFCRFGAISVIERKATINDRRCRGCVRCTHLCPQSAFTIEVRPPSVVQSTLRRLDEEISQNLK